MFHKMMMPVASETTRTKAQPTDDVKSHCNEEEHSGNVELEGELAVADNEKKNEAQVVDDASAQQLFSLQCVRRDQVKQRQTCSLLKGP
jgi:hypothetical protein